MTDIEYLNKYYKGNPEKAIEQLNKGIPVQYIVGEVDFYGYIFKVNKNVLIPRFETEELVENTIKYAKEYLSNQQLDIIDIGTGSGCIAITLKKELPLSNVDAVDISEKALDVAISNAKINKVDINFIKSDVFENVDKKYNIVISNPPYIKDNEDIQDIVKNNEPNIALYAGKDGLDVYKRILDQINEHLQDKYIIAFEIGNTQKEDIIRIIKKYIKDATIIAKQDNYNRDRFIFVIKE